MRFRGKLENLISAGWRSSQKVTLKYLGYIHIIHTADYSYSLLWLLTAAPQHIVYAKRHRQSPTRRLMASLIIFFLHFFTLNYFFTCTETTSAVGAFFFVCSMIRWNTKHHWVFRWDGSWRLLASTSFLPSHLSCSVHTYIIIIYNVVW
jgi:hypothetical protein